MITGAASADAAVVLLDAREGLQEQTRRHGYLLSLLGVKQVLVAVNKMDLVDFSEATFRQLEADYRAFLKPFGIEPLQFVPMSAKHGHNIVKPSDQMPWNTGDTLLGALDHLQQPPAPIDRPLRFVVQDIYRFDDRRLIAGRIESGQLAAGDELVFWPDRKRSRIRKIEAWPAELSPDARAGGAVDCVDAGGADFRRARSYRLARGERAGGGPRVFRAGVLAARRADPRGAELHAEAGDAAGGGAAGADRPADGLGHADTAERAALGDRPQRGRGAGLARAASARPSTMPMWCRRRAGSSWCRTGASAAAG